MEDPFQQEDVVSRIGHQMAKAGVDGRPRNFALFYEAYAGDNEKLRFHLEMLDTKPTQEKLDELNRLYGTDAQLGNEMEAAHARIEQALCEIMELLSREQGSLERYLQLLDSTTAGIDGKEVGQEALVKIASILAKATSATVRQSQESRQIVTARSDELREVRRELEIYKNLAETDHLTQLWNTRAFSRSLGRIYKEDRLRLMSSLVILDIDRFKDVNDRHGHLVGDKVLQVVARIMKSKCGPHVSVFRVGGEEFALIVEGGSDASTEKFVEGIRKAIEQHSFGEPVPGLAITISAGICKAVDASHSDDLYAKADSALYASKTQGRNRVSTYPLPDKAPQRKNWILYQEG
ncbi:diguanylate cyclase [Chelativorans sp. ZYF759]|uniref:GGDEF domain-containing protein n=1 Tax=Chelativorans sp. ZYF759 TaxID=2692213 RepID=UPI00145F6C80|nr:GGDEF domain-containing protein [Chelativorans sp. ZYF759]NMG42042.1 diguanylate cyclase [Chelativorans sp. ZYF759]